MFCSKRMWLFGISRGISALICARWGPHVHPPIDSSKNEEAGKMPFIFPFWMEWPSVKNRSFAATLDFRLSCEGDSLQLYTFNCHRIEDICFQPSHPI